MSTPLPRDLQGVLSTPTAQVRRVTAVATRAGVSRDVSAFVTGGTITCDGRRSMRWSGNLSLALPGGSDLAPRRPGDLLTPFGTRITVGLGLERLDGTSATVPFGVMDVTTSTADITPGAQTVALELVDPAERIDLYRFEEPFTVAPGDIAALVNQVVEDRTGINPGVGSVGRSHQGRVLGLETETGPWAEMQDIVAGFGFRLWYDRSGVLHLDEPAPPRGPATIAVQGPTSVRMTFDQRPPNVAVARGEPADGGAPVQSVVMDENPGSPTFAGTGSWWAESAYGRKTVFYASELIATQAQADASAAALLGRYQALGAAWTITRAFDPTLDPDDVVRVPLLGGDTVDLMVDAVTVAIGGDTIVVSRQVD